MDGWTQQNSPFHGGEQVAQSRVGVRDRIERQGRRVIREFMPDQHRQFYGQLPFLVLGTLDQSGRPWASIVVGPPGFISSPDARTLRVQAHALPGDPLAQTLKPGADIGILGIAPGTRRRNRMNGWVAAVDDQGFTIRVTQAYGNCPMYIQKRQIQLLSESAKTSPTQPQDHLDPAMQDQIRAADTLFIATSYSNSREDITFGADASHRGGKPGFVRIDDDRTLAFPDFAGNLHFNTVGNLMLNPRVGLIFPDFLTGDWVTLTGQAEIIWQGEEVRSFEGAERLFRIRIEQVLYLKQGLPIRAELEEYSPFLDNTGSWEKAQQRLAVQDLRDQYRPFQVIQVESHRDSMRSFYLQPQDDHGICSYEAGQMLPIRWRPAGGAEDLTGLVPISEAPGQEVYRITVAQALEGSFLAILFNSVRVGDLIEALAPRGEVYLNSSRRPVVLLSAGIGIAPQIAMLNQLTKQVDCCGIDRQVWLIHQSSERSGPAFQDHVRRAARLYSNVQVHLVYEPSLGTPPIENTYDGVGGITIDLISSILPLEDYEFYGCGSEAFTQKLRSDLQSINISTERVHLISLE